MHLSIQSGDNDVLRRMGRRHKREDVLRLAEKLRAVRPDFVLGSDFIAGFPTETEKMFENTLDLVEQAQIIFKRKSASRPLSWWKRIIKALMSTISPRILSAM